MNPFVLGLLIGLGSGVIIVPLAFWALWKYKETKVRREIKVMVNKGLFLKPMDNKDFDSEMWKDQITTNPEDLERLPGIVKQKAIKREDLPRQE